MKHLKAIEFYVTQIELSYRNITGPDTLHNNHYKIMSV